MRKLKLLLGFLGILLLSGGVMYSCKSAGEDSFYFEDEELTAADLFVASEVFQELKRQVIKDFKRRQQTISSLSEEDMELYYRLKNEQLYRKETRADALTKLNVLIGYDYDEQLKTILSMVLDVFSSVSFSSSELILANHKYNSNYIGIGTKAVDREAYEVCMASCSNNYWDCIMPCMRSYLDALDELSERDIRNETPAYLQVLEKWEQDQSKCSGDRNDCEEDCEKAYNTAD